MIPSLMYVDYVLDERRREARRQADRFRLVQIARAAQRKAGTRSLARRLVPLLSRLVRDPQATAPEKTRAPMADQPGEVPGT